MRRRGNGWIEIGEKAMQLVKVSVRCEECGHQATIGVPFREGRYPELYCGVCEARDPLIEVYRAAGRRRGPRRDLRTFRGRGL